MLPGRLRLLTAAHYTSTYAGAQLRRAVSLYRCHVLDEPHNQVKPGLAKAKDSTEYGTLRLSNHPGRVAAPGCVNEVIPV